MVPSSSSEDRAVVFTWVHSSNHDVVNHHLNVWFSHSGVGNPVSASHRLRAVESAKVSHQLVSKVRVFVLVFLKQRIVLALDLLELSLRFTVAE